MFLYCGIGLWKFLVMQVRQIRLILVQIRFRIIEFFFRLIYSVLMVRVLYIGRNRYWKWFFSVLLCFLWIQNWEIIDRLMKVNVISVLKLISVVVIIRLKLIVSSVIVLIRMMFIVGVCQVGCMYLKKFFGNMLLWFIMYIRCVMLVCVVILDVSMVMVEKISVLIWKVLFVMQSIIFGCDVFGFLKCEIFGKYSCRKQVVKMKIRLLISVVRKIVCGMMCFVFLVFLDRLLMLLKLVNEKYRIVVLVIIGIMCVLLDQNGWLLVSVLVFLFLNML